MSQGSKRPLAEALAVAEEIQAKLASHCEQIEIAGSIRRTSHSPTGPPMIPPAIRPTVANAMPTSRAAFRPAFSATSPQAIAVPKPPASETLPPNRP